MGIEISCGAWRFAVGAAKLKVYSDLWEAIIVQDEAYGKLLAKVKRAYDGYIHKLQLDRVGILF